MERCATPVLRDVPCRASTLCPYCRGPLASEETVVFCGICRTPHHSGCWFEHQFRCAVFSCPGNLINAEDRPLPGETWWVLAMASAVVLAVLIRLGPRLVFAIT